MPLIRDGAVLVTALEDIVDNLGPLPHPITSPSPEVPVTEEIPASPVMLDDRQQRILQGIDLDPTQLDTIIARTDLPAEIVMQELTMLTLRGVVKRVDGQAYVRKARG